MAKNNLAFRHTESGGIHDVFGVIENPVSLGGFAANNDIGFGSHAG